MLPEQALNDAYLIEPDALPELAPLAEEHCECVREAARITTPRAAERPRVDAKVDHGGDERGEEQRHAPVDRARHPMVAPVVLLRRDGNDRAQVRRPVGIEAPRQGELVGEAVPWQ